MRLVSRSINSTGSRNITYMTIAIDFDGTIVTHEYPAIGQEIPFATETLRMLIADQHRLILWSVREGKLLEDAVNWCRERGVVFYAVNKDYPEEKVEYNNHFSRKIKADLFIDDRNIGGLPDWGQIYQMIKYGKTQRQLIMESLSSRPPMEVLKKKHWWQF